MEDFRMMTNDCIRIGLESEKNGRLPSMKELSLSSYGKLERYGGYSKYRLTAISKAAGILSARQKSIKRGFPTRTPFLSRPVLVSCYGFKIEANNLVIHLDSERCESIPLNPHTIKILTNSEITVRSFTLAETSVSLCISKEVHELEPVPDGPVGVDRNQRNITVGNQNIVTFYDISKTVEIAENTKSITRSLKRKDTRIRNQVQSKYGRRRSDRVKQILHRATKRIVESAKANKQTIVFEEISGIRRLYRRGNSQSRSFRNKMNTWPFREVKRQIEYKAAWEGVPVITLTQSETRGTTMDCPRCGERLQVPVRGDDEHHRQLWCGASSARGGEIATCARS
jgi:putative transposase